MSRFFWVANVLFRLSCNSPSKFRIWILNVQTLTIGKNRKVRMVFSRFFFLLYLSKITGPR